VRPDRSSARTDPLWLSVPTVAECLREERFDEALAWLNAESLRQPGDRALREAIEIVRAKTTEAALTRLGPSDSAPRVVEGVSDSSELNADERYMLGCVDGARSIDALVRFSTLGRHRTIRVLAWLVRRGLVYVPPTTGLRPVAPAQAASVETVIVADGNATQASLARTMLRVGLGKGIVFRSAAKAQDLFELVRQHTADLVVIDYRLPGHGDGIETLRALRRHPGVASVPALLLVQRIEAEYASGRLPQHTELLVRPLERELLAAALRRVLPRLAKGEGKEG
jgi:CheY-like chemotaxis protein